MSAEKKGDARSVRLRPSVEQVAQEAMHKSGLSWPELFEFALLLACPLAERSPSTIRHILVSQGGQ